MIPQFPVQITCNAYCNDSIVKPQNYRVWICNTVYFTLRQKLPKIYP